MSVINEAMIVAVMGASGSGKSAYIKHKLKLGKPSRLIVFDPMREYIDLAEPVSQLSHVVAAVKRKKFRIAFVPSSAKAKEQFDLLCKIAYAAGDCWLVIDELAIVTSAQSAPAGWADCSMRGRHKGMTIIGASQRPASIDKHFFGNASLIRTGRLNFAGDIKTLANVLHVPGDDIAKLKPLEFIERNMKTGEVTTGSLEV